MKKFNATQITLLSCLADGCCHSGSELGLLLNVSRTAIWKHINQLITLGLSIERIHQQGYRLKAPLILLNSSTIFEHLSCHSFEKTIHFHMYANLDSTNRLLKDLPSSTAIEICCTEMQTAGRGRFGRHWFSPFGENIYCSSRWHFDCDLARLSGLSLAVSLAIVAALKDFGIHEDIRVKWPNDIYWQNKKLCGNLIEIIAESNGTTDIVIGTGLNVNSNTALPQSAETPDKPWCSLFDICGQYSDRNVLISYIIMNLEQYLDEFVLNGFLPLMTQWHSLDYLFDKMITVSQAVATLSGRACGVNEAGQLILTDKTGKTHYLSSGDTSIRL